MADAAGTRTSIIPLVGRAVAAPTIEATKSLEEPAALHTRNRPLLTLGVMATTIMRILDSRIANVAQPRTR